MQSPIVRYRDSHGRFCSRADASRSSNLGHKVSTEVSRITSPKTARRKPGYLKPEQIAPLKKPPTKPRKSSPLPGEPQAPPRTPEPRFEPPGERDDSAPPASRRYYEDEEEEEEELEDIAGYGYLEGEDDFLEDEDLNLLDVDEDKYAPAR